MNEPPAPLLDTEALLLERFVPGCVEPGFGTDVLPGFCKTSASLSAAQLSCYALDADLRLNGTKYGQRFREKYFDATFNFCLTHDAELVASLGFEVDGSTMDIWQIQGVKGQRCWLAPLRWERALVRHAIGWASGAGLTEASIVSVEHVEWAARHGHLDPAVGKLRYDVTAKRCGFRKALDGYFVRKLGCRRSESPGVA